MDQELKDNREDRRYELWADGQLAGIAQYALGPGRIELFHTEVETRFARRGLGATLVTYALRDASDRGLEVVPSCSFVAKVIAENEEEFLDLVATSRRASFGLG